MRIWSAKASGSLGTAAILANAWGLTCRATVEPSITEAAGARRWLADVVEPTLRRLRPAIGIRDPLQAYIDVLEHKWLLSEKARRDVGLERAVEAYLEVGAPAPEPVTIEPGSPALPVDDVIE